MERQPYTEGQWKFLCGLVRSSFWKDRKDTEEWAFRRDCSILKALVRRFGVPDTEVMIRGAVLLGWRDLRAVHAATGIGRRWASSAYWEHVNKSKGPARIQQLGDVLNEAMRRAKGVA